VHTNGTADRIQDILEKAEEWDLQQLVGLAKLRKSFPFGYGLRTLIIQQDSYELYELSMKPKCNTPLSRSLKMKVGACDKILCWP